MSFKPSLASQALSLICLIPVLAAAQVESELQVLPKENDTTEATAATNNTDTGTTEKRSGDWLVGGFDTKSKWITGGLIVGLGGYLAYADEEDARSVGDYTQFLPLVFGAGFATSIKDWEGLKEIVLAGGTALVATHGGKAIAEKERPDGTDENSWPSGHTSASTTGAAFIWRRYGAMWGAPASVLAAYTGASRVNGQKHYLDDVISGAAIGIISNLIWTNPIDDRVELSLFPTDGGVVMKANIEFGGGQKKGARTQKLNELPTRYFLWEFGRADVSQNDVAVPGGTPTVDWRFNEKNNPTTTALIQVAWTNSDWKHGWYTLINPFEVREDFVTPVDISHGDLSVPAGTELRSTYSSYDIRAGYMYGLISGKRQALSLNAELALYDTYVELALADDPSQETSEDVTLLRPTLGASYQLSLGKHWWTFIDAAAWADSELKIVDFSAKLAYKITSKWALSGGYRYINRELDTGRIYNKTKRNELTLGVWYAW